MGKTPAETVKPKSLQPSVGFGEGRVFRSLADAKAKGIPVIAYGQFLNDLVSFLIVAFAVFVVVKQVNRLKRPAPAAALATKDCAFCASSIPVKATRCPHCTSELKAA